MMNPAAAPARRTRFHVTVADERHEQYAAEICAEMASSAQVRGTGIAKRSPEYIVTKMREGKAVIAFSAQNEWAGFCYIESWGHGAFVANSGLIVAPRFRHSGLARAIKRRVFHLSRARFPKAKLFGLTTSLAVMKINSELGYVPVTYSELTDDSEFWAGCTSCVNHPILESKGHRNCLCTAMLFDPSTASRRSAGLLRDVARATHLYARYRAWRDAGSRHTRRGGGEGR